MKVDNYLYFNGKTDEALAYYAEKLGAKVEALMRFSDCPARDQMPKETWDKVMHSNFRIGDTQLMASDGECGGTTNFDGFALSISVSSDAEAERLYNALLSDGEVTMPMGETFFASRFGMLKDKFGVHWMMINEKKPTN